MAWRPISGTVPQYHVSGEPASGYYLKGYIAGTTTPLSMASDSTGAGLLAKCQLNSDGYPLNGSAAIFVPHFDQDYKLALYSNATDADADATGSAIWFPADFVVEGVSQWQSSDAAIYVNATTYRYENTDKTADLHIGQRVYLQGGADRWATIKSFSFSTHTDVVLEDIIDGTKGSTVNISTSSASLEVRNHNAPTTISTLADLRAMKQPEEARFVRLIGSVSAGDGAGGEYYWSSTSTSNDDGRSIIKPTAVGGAEPGRWLLIQETVEIFDDLLTLHGADNIVVNVGGMYAVGDGAGGAFYWDSTLSQSDHDGGVVIDPDHTQVVGSAGWWSSVNAGTGCWRRIIDGTRFNILWFHDNTNDPGPSIQRTVDYAVAKGTNKVTTNWGAIGREIYFPMNPNNGGLWEWGTTQVEFEDITSVTETDLNLVTASPTFVRCTSNITSLFRTGYRNKSRQQRIGGVAVDINGNTLTSIVLTGEALWLQADNIEVSDSAGTGSIVNIVKHDDSISNVGVGSGVGCTRAKFFELNDSGNGAITGAMVYSNYMINSEIYGIRVSKNATYGVQLESTQGVVQSCNVRNIYAEPGTGTNTALVQLHSNGNAVNQNSISDLFGNNRSTYGVEMTVTSGNIDRNIFNINEDGWTTSTFNQRDNFSTITDNKYVADGAEEQYLEFSLADDTATFFTPWRTSGILEFNGSDGNGGTWMAIISYNTVTAASTVLLAGGGDVEVTNGALTGTTGTDIKMTVSSNVSLNRIYLENRSGSTRTIYIRVRG